MQVTMWLTETMKRFPILILLTAILSAVGITSCKTTEENYRTAYETAVIQRQEATGIDSTIYGKIRNSANTSTLLVGGVELPMRSEYIGYDADGGSSRDKVKLYNIVVGQFRQIFNAKQMRQRLLDAGYDSAMVVHTREPLYYVITETSSTPAEALEAWRKVKSDKGLVIKSPLPFILRPAHFRN